MADTLVKRAWSGTTQLLRRWFDSTYPLDPVPPGKENAVDWVRCLPFLLAHAACLAVI